MIEPSQIIGETTCLFIELEKSRIAIKLYRDELEKIKAGKYPKSGISLAKEEFRAIAGDALERGEKIMKGDI